MRLCQVEAALGAIVAALEPAGLEAATAARLVEEFARVERLAGAGKALAAGRVAESGVWRDAGERSAAHWLARRSGTSVTSALATLETAARSEEMPALDAALRAGALSGAQAGEIASAAGADPDAAGALVEAARDESLAGLRATCRRVWDPLESTCRHASLSIL